MQSYNFTSIEEETMTSEIFKDTLFSESETEIIESKFEKLNLKKGTTILNLDDPVLHQYFVQKGCLRTFFVDKQGKEHTIQFAIQDWWISDYTAFFTASNAIMNIECIQDSVLYKLSRADMEELYLEVPSLGTFFRRKMERAFARYQKRILANLSQSAKERYFSFINTYPNIEQNVKNYHIASYLGITTESLSRIRKEMSQK